MRIVLSRINPQIRGAPSTGYPYSFHTEQSSDKHHDWLMCVPLNALSVPHLSELRSRVQTTFYLLVFGLKCGCPPVNNVHLFSTSRQSPDPSPPVSQYGRPISTSDARRRYPPPITPHQTCAPPTHSRTCNASR